MQHPTSFFGLSRRANTRHLLFLCLASTFLAAASLYSSLSSFAVQAAGTEGNGGRHAMYTAGASGISGERQQGEQDETALLTGRMYDGEQDQVDAQEAPMELQERSQSHSRSKSDGFFEYGYRSPRLQKKKKMSLLTHLLPALAFVVILNLGAAAVYLHSQKKSLEQLPVQTDAELEKVVTEEAADVAPTPVAPTPVAPTPVAPTPTEAKATIAKLKETLQFYKLLKIGIVALGIVPLLYPELFPRLLSTIQLTTGQYLMLAGALIGRHIFTAMKIKRDLKEKAEAAARQKAADEKKKLTQLAEVVHRLTAVKALKAELLGALQLVAAAKEDEMERLPEAQLKDYRLAAGMLATRLNAAARLMRVSIAPNVASLRDAVPLLKRVADNLAKLAAAELTGEQVVLRELVKKGGKFELPVTEAELEEVITLLSMLQYNATGN